ncbi:streptophobe family protein [Streptomyces pseudovenezuelae]|uniref:streptophobe family protein n=1 Tax=Streptomyces pseudovenezuelae TaxID=67350 RepID=UPI002E7FC033|nr:streptophobe family protein [Streptomyces pseudovenezuelae]WUA93637.1 streptophobe family protein [Streptomyces pseudovenezuelae]
MPASSSPVPAPRGSVGRHALEGGAAVVAAALTMSACGATAALALGAQSSTALSRLVPALLSMSVGGHLTLDSGSAATGGGRTGALGGMSGGGLTLELGGQVSALPLTLTFLGTMVLALGFFRPLRRRGRPTPDLLWARFGGALATTLALFTGAALLGRGTVRLPKGLTQGMGTPTGGSGDGTGGIPGAGLSSVGFRTDVVSTVFFALLWVVLVVGIGCLAARRTTLPRPLALSRLRLKWHPLTSTLAGMCTALCCIPLALGALAGAAALVGPPQAAKAAGAMLLAGPNLLVVALTSGLGSSWHAAIRQQQSEAGGMTGGFGGTGTPLGSAGMNRSVAVSSWSGTGLPLWLIGLIVLLGLLARVGYLAAARTPVRTARQEADAVLGRHVELALRAGVTVGMATMLFCLTAQGSAQIGMSMMGSEMGGMTAGLHSAVRLSGLTGFVLAAVCAYGGSRLHALRISRRAPVGPPALKAGHVRRAVTR